MAEASWCTRALHSVLLPCSAGPEVHVALFYEAVSAMTREFEKLVHASRTHWLAMSACGLVTWNNLTNVFPIGSRNHLETIPPDRISEIDVRLDIVEW